jgi:hypothetical protein
VSPPVAPPAEGVLLAGAPLVEPPIEPLEPPIWPDEEPLVLPAGGVWLELDWALAKVALPINSAALAAASPIVRNPI